MATKDMREWIISQGGVFHPSLVFKSDPVYGGSSLFATAPISKGTVIVQCPSQLVISKELAEDAVRKLMGDDDDAVPEGARETEVVMDKEIMWIKAYITLHWIFGGSELSNITSIPTVLQHTPYISTLPPSSSIPTSMYFSEAEMELIKGTNLYHATKTRVAELRNEWEDVRRWVCRGGLRDKEEGFGWERYLLASTYLSSRAFSSSLLQPTFSKPTLTSTSTSTSATSTSTQSYPILIPGVDSFNHSSDAQGVYRKEDLTEIDDYHEEDEMEKDEIQDIGMEGKSSNGAGKERRDPVVVLRRDVEKDEQVFISYGEKSNESFILGYGFIPSPNPDDDIILKLGLSSQSDNEELTRALEKQELKLDERHVVGKDGEVPERLWRSIRMIIRFTTSDEVVDGEDDGEENLEIEMDTADMLVQMLESKIGMIQGLLDRWEAIGDTLEGEKVVEGEKDGVRREIWEVCGRYLQGQLEILGKCHDGMMENMDEMEAKLEMQG